MVNPRNKIKTVAELSLIIQEARQQQKTVAHCHGVFDFVHLGHIRYFRYAKERADIIYVGAVADRFVKKGPNRPYMNEALRLEWLASIEDVDYVVLNEHEGPWDLMRTLRPDLYFKSESDKPKLEDPTHGIHQDIAVMQEVGGRFAFIPEEVTLHSTDIFKLLGKE
jgi:cytidyltransferase-like protein